MSLGLRQDDVRRGFAAVSLIARGGAEGMKPLLLQKRPAQRPHCFGLPDLVERHLQGVPRQKTLPFPVATWIAVSVGVDVKAVQAVGAVKIILGDDIDRPISLL